MDWVLGEHERDKSAARKRREKEGEEKKISRATAVEQVLLEHSTSLSARRAVLAR